LVSTAWTQAIRLAHGWLTFAHVAVLPLRLTLPPNAKDPANAVPFWRTRRNGRRSAPKKTTKSISFPRVWVSAARLHHAVFIATSGSTYGGALAAAGVASRDRSCCGRPGPRHAPASRSVRRRPRHPRLPGIRRGRHPHLRHGSRSLFSQAHRHTRQH